MLDGDDFSLDDIPVPSASNYADDGPPGVSAEDVASSNAMDFDRFDLAKRDSSSGDADDANKSSNAISCSKSSVLGTELAKKRLQAFCTQKKQLNSTGKNFLSFNQNLRSPLKKTGNVFKTDRTDDIEDKTKNQAFKKSKKAPNGYEKSRNTLSEILELKKEEERKLALVKLGIPLGLVPGGTQVKGLTTKPMPTKAMPPIKNFLDPHQVELLLDKAMTKDFDFKAESFKLDKKSDIKSDTGGKNSRERRRYKHKYSDRYRSRDSRDDKYRSRERTDSRSKHDRKESVFEFSNKKSDASDKKCGDDKRESANFPIKQSKKIEEITGKKSIENIFDLDVLSAQIRVPNKDDFQIDSVQQISKNEIKDDKDFDIFSFDDTVAKETENFTEEKDSKETVASEVQHEFHTFNKFLREKFIPFADVNEASESPKESVRSQKTVSYSDASENSNERLSINKNKEQILYSPGMESSKESTPVRSPFSIKSAYYAANEEKKDLKPDKTNLFHLWSDIERTCYPKMHYSDECYRKTTRLPYLSYCENLNFCECTKIQSRNYEKLVSSVSQIVNSFSYNQNSNVIVDSSRNWYPKVSDVFKNSVLPEILSNWETDDSLSQQSLSLTKQNSSNSNKSTFDNNSSKELQLNFKDLHVSKNISPKIEISSYSISSVADPSCNTLTTHTKPCVSSLDSEYEKFMEAVTTKDDNQNSTSNDMDWKECEETSTIPKNSFTSKNFKFIDEDITDNLIDNKLLNNTKATNSIINTNVLDNEKSKQETIVPNQFLLDVSKSEAEKGVVVNETKDEGCWSSDDLSNDQKNDFLKYSSVSPKPSEKRKGHAKISSRRHKGKHKNSSKKKFYQSSTSTDSSNSEESSSSSTNSSKDNNSGSGTSSSSSSSSSDSSSGSSSSSDTSSSSDLSSSTSGSSLDEKRSKSKKKKLLSKKEIRKLSKSKRKRKKIYAKAKELARKLRKKKRKKKMKEKLLAQDETINKADSFLYNKENINEFDVIKKNEDIPLQSEEIDNSSSITKKISKRKHLGKKSKVKSKKRKHESDNSSSDSTSSSSSSSSSSSESGESTDDGCRKRTRDSSDNSEEYHSQAKKSKNDNSDGENDVLDMNTLMNIKREAISDEEEPKKNIKENEPPCKVSRSNIRHDIINADELQNDFLQYNKNNDVIVKTEKIIDASVKEELNKYKTESVTSIEPLSSETMNTCDENASNDNSTTENKDQTPTQTDVPKIEIETTRIERIESIKTHRERKPSRWGVAQNSEYHSRINNSTLIEVPIQKNIEPDLVNSYSADVKSEFYRDNANSNSNTYNVDDSETKTESKVYKIQTISSRNVIPNIQNYDMNMENYENYDVFGKDDMSDGAYVNNIEPVMFNETREPLRKISLDDRINMVLQCAEGGEINEQSLFPEKSSTKITGILVTGGTKLVDPRIARGKKVSFADGFYPGQDSDCENDAEVASVKNTTPNSEISKKKKRKSCGGHAYPCPPSWPDYHPRWDKLPPPAPPPGSPPPELCDKNLKFTNVNSNLNSLSRIPRISNILVT